MPHLLFTKFSRMFATTAKVMTKVSTESDVSVPPLDREKRSGVLGLDRMSDVLALCEQERKKMASANPFFTTLKDTSIPAHIRMSFAPYMLYFSINASDFLDYIKIDKPEKELNELERRVNTFINEDNFHYNFYLRDLELLGYTFEKFGSVAGVLRHVWATEGLTTRKLVYSCFRAISRDQSPFMAMTICETLEAGLLDLFTVVYKHIYKAKNGEFFPKVVKFLKLYCSVSLK